MYADYKDLIGRPYKGGEDDCYGLCRQYYKRVFGLELENWARPEEWWVHPELSLVDDLFQVDGWENVGTNFRNLKQGDGLIFSLIQGRANHVGVYVGNGMFIHHVFRRMSCEESFAQKWQSRCLMVVRHAKVTEFLKGQRKTIELKELREHVKP